MARGTDPSKHAQFRRTDAVMLVLFSIRWRLEGFQLESPDVKLRSLVAAEG